MTPPKPIEEEDLHAYIDGELDAERMNEVEAYICANPAIAERVAAYRRDTDAIARAFASLPLYEPKLETDLDTLLARPGAGRRAWFAQPWLRAAAILAIFLAGLAAGWIGRPSASDPLGRELADYAAQASTAYALADAGSARAIDVTAPQALASGLSQALRTDLRLRQTSAEGLVVTAANILEMPGGQAAQLSLRQGQESYVLLMRARPEATEIEPRSVTTGAVTTVVWEDDEHALICALSGTAPAPQLERAAHLIYSDLFE